MKISFSTKLVFAALAGAFAISSCNNSPYPDYEMSENGLYSRFYKHDEAGVKPKEGDIVRVSMSYKNSKDSVLFDSKKGNPSGTTYIEFPLGKSTFAGSFEDALMMMSVGDSASFIINADSVYTKTFMVKELPKYIEKGSNLTFEATLLKITSKDEVEKENQKKKQEQQVMMELRKTEEPKSIEKYLTDNKITAKPTASGLYYIQKSGGKGPKPNKGDTVKVNYTGRLLDGTVFDTSDKEVAKASGVYDERRPYEPISFPIGTGQVIQGWEEGLAMMSAGTKAQFIIPSVLGYGERGGGPIPPFSPLVFEVEMVKIVKAK